MTGAAQRRRDVARDARALAAAQVARYEGDPLRALVAIRTTWRTNPDNHEVQVAIRAFSTLLEGLTMAEREVWMCWYSDILKGLTMAEREVWMCWHSDIEDVTWLARAIAGRHARHTKTAQTRQVAA